MRNIFSSRSGKVENTTFSILSPDGKKSLVRAARSPDWSFRNASAMSTDMIRIADQFPGAKQLSESKPPLPLAADVRLGVNIAAGDNMPIAILYAENDAERSALVERVAKLSWQTEFIGRFCFAIAKDAADFKPLGDHKPTNGILIARPGTFGLTATAISQANIDATDEQLAEAMRKGADQFKPLSKKQFRNHVRAGVENSVYWETKLPVTDAMENRARQTTKKQIDRK